MECGKKYHLPDIVNTWCKRHSKGFLTIAVAPLSDPCTLFGPIEVIHFGVKHSHRHILYLFTVKVSVILVKEKYIWSSPLLKKQQQSMSRTHSCSIYVRHTFLRDAHTLSQAQKGPRVLLPVFAEYHIQQMLSTHCC